MKRNILFLLCLLLAMCKPADRQASNPDSPFEVDFSSIPVFDSGSSIIDSIIYVPLETNDNILLSSIDKIVVGKNDYFILDDQRKAIFIFSKGGHFINKIDRIGKGPGEYIQIQDFDIDQDQNIFLYDNNSCKIIKYPTDGNNFEEFKLNNYFFEFRVENNFLLIKNLYNPEGITSHVAIYDYKKDTIKILFDKDAYVDEFSITGFSPFYFFRSNREIYFNPRFTNEICKFDENFNQQPVIRINGPFPTEKFINETKKDFFAVYKQNQYITDIRNIYANSEMITMTIDKQFSHKFFLSKKTKKCFLSPDLQKNKYFGINSICGVDGDKFITVLNFENVMQPNWIDNVNKSSLSTGNKDILSKITPGSNPVLILIKFKEF